MSDASFLLECAATDADKTIRLKCIVHGEANDYAPTACRRCHDFAWMRTFMEEPRRITYPACSALFRPLILALIGMLPGLGGCYAPLHSYGVPARTLPDEFRTPYRTEGPPINYSRLTMQPPANYLLGPDDTLDITIPGLYPRSETVPLRVQLMANGQIHLPEIGSINIGGKNLIEAQETVIAAYAAGFLQNPRVNITLVKKATTTVLVLGQVINPGAKDLPKYQDDVGHALAAAGGFTDDAMNVIEIHRQPQAPMQSTSRGHKLPELLPPVDEKLALTFMFDPITSATSLAGANIQRIQLRGPGANSIKPEDVKLYPGDVVVVPHRKNEVFFVVGRLSQTNTVRFTIGDRERELGIGFILPPDREIDVVTAVTMAGYIDPIESPTTVTLQRDIPGGDPFLIHVDLIKARYDRLETVLVQAGDIIYLNPDSAWWMRHTFERVLPDLITIPYAASMDRWLIGRRGTN